MGKLIDEEYFNVIGPFVAVWFATSWKVFF